MISMESSGQHSDQCRRVVDMDGILALSRTVSWAPSSGGWGVLSLMFYFVHYQQGTGMAEFGARGAVPVRRADPTASLRDGRREGSGAECQILQMLATVCECLSLSMP